MAKPDILHDRAAAPSLGPKGISVHGNQAIKVVQSCTIRKPALELYAFWRQFENLPKIVKHPMTITPKGGVRSHWSVSAPFGDHRVEWDAVVINDKPGQLIAWRSLDGAEIPNAGSVRFEPVAGGADTEVTVQLEYDPPGGRLSTWFAKLTGNSPKQQVAEALHRLRALMETGRLPEEEPPKGAAFR